MRKVLLTILATAVLAGCSKDDVIKRLPQQEIAFGNVQMGAQIVQGNGLLQMGIDVGGAGLDDFPTVHKHPPFCMYHSR